MNKKHAPYVTICARVPAAVSDWIERRGKTRSRALREFLCDEYARCDKEGRI